jgi:hypothetical protein
MSAEPEKGGDRLELVSWGLLAAATLASAWCAYQASLWSSVQSRSMARASVAQFASLRETTVANRNLMVDVGTFLHYITADLHGDAKVTRFLREHARPELKPALEAWIADRAAGHTELSNPFASPQYRVADLQKALDLNEQAATLLDTAHTAILRADAYLLHTVLFALSLFLLGATTQARRRSMQRATLILGALAFTLTTISMARLPRAPWHHPHDGEKKIAPVDSDPPSG